MGDPESDGDVEEMKTVAANSDVCFFWLSTMSGEGGDRDSLSLDNDSHVASVADHCKKSLVVVTTPGAALLPWANAVDAIFVNFMPGVASAFATMDVVVGDVNPSGHLPITFPAVENQEGFTEEQVRDFLMGRNYYFSDSSLLLSQYPGLNEAENVTYTEGWAFGYRFYHKHDEKPAYYFGEGLSYTTFDVMAVSINDNHSVKIEVKNTGKTAGSAVPQLYLQLPDECDEPQWMLKKFTKIAIDPGAMATIEFNLDSRDISTWDVEEDAWKRCAGDATIRVAFSANFDDEKSYIEAGFRISP